MKKQVVLIGVFLVLLISIIACGSSGVVVITPTENQTGDQGALTISQGSPEPTKVPRPTNAPLPTATVPVGTSRSNPAPVGAEVHVEDMKFVVTGIVRPTDSIVKKGNMFNSEAGTGKEYMFVTLSITCEKTTDQQCTLNVYAFKALGSDGIQKDPEFIAGVEDLLEFTTFYGGATVTGNIPFIVTQGDANVLLVYQPLFGDSFYLALPKQ